MATTDRLQETVDRLDPGAAYRLAGLLDLDGELDLGTELPRLWHWVYFLDAYPQRELAPDGHATTGLPAPPGPGYRRMFAGGRVSFHRPLRFAADSCKRVQMLRHETKHGRSGELTFATVGIEIAQQGEIAVSEEQDIVYIPADGANPAPLSAPETPTAEESPIFSRVVDERTLFRFSALTYNAHRIHYDAAFAASESHPGLVVHGPLQAMILIEAARRSLPGGALITRFSYRLQAPAYGPGKMTAYAARPGTVTLRDNSGRITARATAQW
jgi:3-methylfumaryl-CoA hydratase